MRHYATIFLLLFVIGCSRAVDTHPVVGDKETQTKVAQAIDDMLKQIDIEGGVDKIVERFKGRLPAPDVAVLKGTLQSIKGSTSFDVIEILKHGQTAYRVKTRFKKEHRENTATLILVEKGNRLELSGLF